MYTRVTILHFLRRTATVIAVAVTCAFAQSAPPPPQAQQGAASQTVSQPGASNPQSAPELQTSSAPLTPGKTADDRNAPEVATQDTDTVFHVSVDLVEVRAVVRDAQGHLVGGLKKEDFQLLDNGKPQVISRFALEEAGAKAAAPHSNSANAGAPETAAAPATAAPQRYVAYLFDDVHLPFEALSKAEAAAAQQLQSLSPTDRAAIFTISGQNYLDFTDDRNALRDTLNRLRPHPITNRPGGSNDCPQMSYYMADQIENHQDAQALSAATQDAVDCQFYGNASNSAGVRLHAEVAVHSTARQWLQLGAHETQVTLDTLRRIVQRTAMMPGQRTIVFISSGFLNTEQRQEELAMEERALHAGVIINTMDARGLYTSGDDASKGVARRHMDALSQNVDEYLARYAEREKSVQADVMREMANVTGGKFFHNSNDLGAGFAELAGAPEYSYLLAFTPLDLKRDGRWHNLKVTVNGQQYNIQARSGYYSPTQAENAAAQATRQIEEAVFSHEEWHDIPVQVHTQFFKVSDDAAKLSVLVRVDARRLHFRKADGRNCDDVTVVSALFDRNGKFISGSQKVMQMRFKDETLGSRLMAGLTLKTNFDVKAGSYLVRLVVRDNGGQMSAQNDAVDIP